MRLELPARGLGLSLPVVVAVEQAGPGTATAAALSSVDDTLPEDMVERPKLAERGGNGRLHLSGWITPHVLISHSAKSVYIYIYIHALSIQTNTSIPKVLVYNILSI